MFTICFFVFRSLTAVSPQSEACETVWAKQAEKAVAACTASRDPISICEAQRVGATSIIIRIRQLGDQ